MERRSQPALALGPPLESAAPAYRWAPVLVLLSAPVLVSARPQQVEAVCTVVAGVAAELVMAVAGTKI